VTLWQLSSTQLTAWLFTLNVRDRQIMLYHDVCGLSWSAIAELMTYDRRYLIRRYKICKERFDKWIQASAIAEGNTSGFTPMNGDGIPESKS
jgi:hypothetical protein